MPNPEVDAGRVALDASARPDGLGLPDAVSHDTGHQDDAQASADGSRSDAFVAASDSGADASRDVPRLDPTGPCANDNDCGEDRRCIAWGCQPCLNAGGRCTTDADCCGTMMHCHLGYCMGALQITGQPCAVPEDCLTDICRSGLCACIPPGGACPTPGASDIECCSGQCRPDGLCAVTGPGSFCMADEECASGQCTVPSPSPGLHLCDNPHLGDACDPFYDPCDSSSGCVHGTCCAGTGQPCASSSDCCEGGSCDATTHTCLCIPDGAYQGAATTCCHHRSPTTGFCSSCALGSVCATPDDCCGDGRGGPTTCRSGQCIACTADNIGCSTAGECCSGICQNHFCGACHADGSHCNVGASCCSGTCTANVCQTPSGPGCTANGAPCAIGADCCSSTCYQGVCNGTGCRSDHVTCASDAECCSGSCDRVDRVCVAACRGYGASCTGPGQCCNTGCYGGSCCVPNGGTVPYGIDTTIACCSGYAWGRSDLSYLTCDRPPTCSPNGTPLPGGTTGCGDCCSGCCATDGVTLSCSVCR